MIVEEGTEASVDARYIWANFFEYLAIDLGMHFFEGDRIALAWHINSA